MYWWFAHLQDSKFVYGSERYEYSTIKSRDTIIRVSLSIILRINIIYTHISAEIVFT